MKKITFFIYNIYTTGGTEKVVSLIANELSKKYEVELISMCKTKDEPAFKLNKNIKVINIMNKVPEPLRLYFPYLQLKLMKALKNYKTDAFICAGMRYVGLTIFMRRKTKYIAWEHFTSAQTKFLGITWYGRKMASKYADNIVVLTKRDMQKNIEMFNTKSKIDQIYNPIEITKQKVNYDINSKLIVSSGRLCYQKGYDILLDVASKVFEKHPDWQWHIYGDGPEKENLEKSIIEKRLEKNVILKGRTNKMLELYKEYAMFVMTSRFEGFAMVNIEAHYSKLPIVSFDCDCGPDEIIQDGVNGYLIECFDTDKMANKINYLIENPDVRKEMSDNTFLDKEKLQMKNIIKEWDKIL